MVKPMPRPASVRHAEWEASQIKFDAFGRQIAGPRQVAITVWVRIRVRIMVELK